jgi:hypothetical protein
MMSFLKTPNVVVPIALILLIYGTTTYAQQRTVFVPVAVGQTAADAK